MKPYYEQDGITIYHADCREVLGALNLAECVLLTDPPYGVNGGRGGDARDYGKARYESAWADSEEYIAQVCAPTVAEITTVVRRAAVTPGIRCLRMYPPPADMGCFWTPAAATHGPWGMTTMQPILYYGKDYRAGRGAWPTGRQMVEASDRNGHPCPKPVRAWEWLAAKVAQDEDILLDPFLGSGTTTRVAKNLGLRAIGIEIEERFCEIAAKRLAQGVLFGSTAA